MVHCFSLSRFLFLLVALISILFYPGCSGAQHEKQDSVIPQVSSDNAYADQYFVEDPSCMDERGTDDIGTTSIERWAEGGSAQVAYDFTGVSSIPSLSSDIISGSIYNYYQRTTCTDGTNSPYCSGTAKVLSLPKPLNICRKNGPYARTSVEGVSLASMAAINSAFDFYKTLSNKNPELRKTQLVVLPKVEIVSNSSRFLMTDNLAYIPKFQGSPAFVIFPKGESSVKEGLWKDTNLWEIPWALAHEYGHHVFRTHTGIADISHAAGLPTTSIGRVRFAGAMMNTPLHSYVPPAMRQSEASLNLLDVRTVSLSDHWGAVNEGYADLFAHYAGGSPDDELNDLDCFSINREISAPKFSTGQVKALDEEILAEYLSKTTTTVASCNTPHFQDVHTVGAIIARGIDQLFSTTAGLNGKEAAVKKAELLVSWATQIGQLVSDRKKAGTLDSVDIEDLLQPALELVSPGKTLSKSQCDGLRISFPVYAVVWFKAGGAFHCAE